MFDIFNEAAAFHDYSVLVTLQLKVLIYIALLIMQ